MEAFGSFSPAPPPSFPSLKHLHLWEEMVSCFVGSVWSECSPKKSRACLCHKTTKYVNFLTSQKNSLLIADHKCHVLLSYLSCIQTFTALHPSSFCVKKVLLLELHDLKYMTKRRRCVNPLIILNWYLTCWTPSVLTDKMVRKAHFSKCSQKEKVRIISIHLILCIYCIPP